MGMLHGALINSLPDVKIVAIADTSKWVLKAFKSVLSEVSYFLSYKKMLDSCDLDAVIIATPSFSHVPVAREAAERHVHLFIEKPLSNSLRTALDLQDIVLSTRVKGMVGFCARYYESFQRAKQVLDSGRLGRVKSVLAENYLADVKRNESGWRFNKAVSGGGVVIDYSIHMIDLLYWFFGDVASVEAMTRKIYSENVEDEVEASFKFKNGIPATLKSSWSNMNYRKSYMRMEVMGEEAFMVATDQTLTVVYKAGKEESFSYPDLYKGYFLDIGGSNFSLQMKDFHAYLRGDNVVTNTIQSAVEVQKIVEAIYQSSEKHATANLERI